MAIDEQSYFTAIFSYFGRVQIINEADYEELVQFWTCDSCKAIVQEENLRAHDEWHLETKGVSR